MCREKRGEERELTCPFWIFLAGKDVEGSHPPANTSFPCGRTCGFFFFWLKVGVPLKVFSVHTPPLPARLSFSFQGTQMGLLIILKSAYLCDIKDIYAHPFSFEEWGCPEVIFCWTPPLTYFWILCDGVWVAFGLFFLLVGSVFRSFFFFLQIFNPQNLAALSVPLCICTKWYSLSLE